MAASICKWCLNQKLQRESCTLGIKLAVAVLGSSECEMAAARLIDPLPLLLLLHREVCTKLSNNRILLYAKYTREVVGNLRWKHVAVNEEIKAANRCQERLEKTLDHNRKDFVLNHMSKRIRTCRPHQEKVKESINSPPPPPPPPLL